MQRKASAVWKGGLKDGKGNGFIHQRHSFEYALFLYYAV
jgi:hypothetical protein